MDPSELGLYHHGRDQLAWISPHPPPHPPPPPAAPLSSTSARRERRRRFARRRRWGRPPAKIEGPAAAPDLPRSLCEERERGTRASLEEDETERGVVW
uniref:Uncharacterized protein n=1 Tax=Oryza rufipogon TaxID=4529 RepID=A0A0E0NSL8_ORYRU